MSRLTVPGIRIGELAISRLVVGGNPVSGFSHGNPARTTAMLDYFSAANVKKLLKRCEECGIDTAFMRADNHVIRLMHEYWNEGGKIQWVAQTATEENPISNIEKAARFGAKAVYLHGGTIDTYFEEGRHDEVRKQLEKIRELGLPAGCASHIPENILEVEKRGWAPDFYMVCLYNIPGYKGKLGVDQDEKFRHDDRAKALDVMAQVPRPCIAYKILAAGRLEPRAAFKETFSRIKAADGVNVGMFPPDAASGDIVAENVGYVNEFAAR
ncbi:MAG TPA: hypothetical protein ENN09_03500 [Planctomycetes bacterium]|nr:hypothetical protein [Planctomycetota bacterium]